MNNDSVRTKHIIGTFEEINCWIKLFFRFYVFLCAFERTDIIILLFRIPGMTLYRANQNEISGI